MNCYFDKGRIYKGSAAEISVPVVPACFSAETNDITVQFYTDGEGSIEFSVSAETLAVSGNVGTVIFTPEQLEALADGQLRYTSVLAGYFTQEWETQYFLVTPSIHTVIDFVTTDDVDSIVASAISEADLVTQSDLDDYAKLTDIPSLDGYATEQYVDSAVTASTQNMVTSSSITNIWVGTEQQYDAITNKDNSTLYIIK